MSINHIAIIMDGNRRWAKANSMSLKEAYKNGVENLYKTIENSIEFNLKFLTVFGFSTENWNRSKQEIKFLLSLFDNFLDEAILSITKKNVKVRFIGDLNKFDSRIQDKINQLTVKSKLNSKITVTIAVNYGGMYDIVQATKSLIENKHINNIDIDDIDEKTFDKFLLNKEIPKPDLLIRTGGEKRLSNFLLWDLAYTELLFIPQMWPDFNYDLLKYSIDEYNKRTRKYGGNEF